MTRWPLVVLLPLVALSGCRIFGSGIPCEGSSDCPTRFPVCSEREDGRFCVGEGEGPPVEGGDDGGVVPHDAGPPPLDAGAEDGGHDVDGGGQGVDGGGQDPDGGQDGGGLVVEPCELLSVHDVATLCLEGETAAGTFTVAVEGDGFIVLSTGEQPRVSVGLLEATSVEATGCTRLLSGDDLCTTLTATFTLSGDIGDEIILGDHDLSVENPTVLGCDAAHGTLSVKRSPIIEEAPSGVCPGSPIVIVGTHLGEAPVVRLGGAVADEVVLFVAANKLRARFYEMPTSGPLEVDNGGCVATLNDVSLDPPVPFEQVFPTVLFDPLGDPLPLYVQADVAWNVPTAVLHDGVRELTFPNFTALLAADAALFEVDTGALATGTYTLEVVPAAGTCPIEVSYGMTVPGAATDLTGSNLLTASASFDAVDQEVVVASWPWVDPEAPDLGGPHFPHVFLKGPTALSPRTAVVRPGGHLVFTVSGSELAVGEYTVYASDTHGVVHRAAQPLIVYADPPMTILDVTPKVLPRDQTVTLNVIGENLQALGFSLTGGVVCWSELDNAYNAMGFTAVTASGSQLLVEIPAAPTSDACHLVLQRGDGAIALFNGLSRPAAEGPAAFHAGPSLSVPRTGLAAAALQVTPHWGLAYAVGGSDDTGPLDAVESLLATSSQPIGRWRQQTPLPVAVEDAAAVGADRTLIVIGGFDGTAARDEVWRAEVLPKDSAPDGVVTDVGAVPEAFGLDPGHYHYRVSAVRSASSRWPGEGAATDLIAVQVRPEVPQPRAVTLQWSPSVDVVSYRVYRTSAPGDPPDTMTLLAEVTSPQLIDGGAELPSSQEPRLENDLSDFVLLTQLGTPRSAHGAVAVKKSDGSHSIFVLGGASVPTTPTLVSVERLDVAYGPAETLVVTSHTVLPELGSARRSLGAFVVDPSVRETYSGDTIVFAGPGLSEQNGSTAFFETFLDDGTGTGWTTWPTGTLPDAVGYAFTYHGNNVVLVGGHSPQPHMNVYVHDPCDDADCTSLGGWTETTSLATPRLRSAAATVRGRVLVIGGEGIGGALSSVEMTGPPQ